MSKPQTTIPPFPFPKQLIPKAEGSPLVWIMVSCIVLIFILQTIQNHSSKPKLSDGRFANRKEIKAMRRKGRKQRFEKIPDKSSLYLGRDRRLWLTDVNQSISGVGQSGSGKTVSLIDPSIMSAIEQGWTLLVYDVKGELMKRHAAIAAANGYDVHCFAPGFGYSGSINFLDFMRDALDDGMATEIAHVLNANFAVPGSKPDPFFGPQGDALLKTIFMLAKAGPHQDLPAAWQILSLSDPGLDKRFIAAKKYKRFATWVGESAKSLIAASTADETVAGIITSAITYFQMLMTSSLLPSLVKTTIPLDLQGKQIIFFQPDLQRQTATTPLIATAIHMLITRNVNAEINRDRPLAFIADEFDTARFPSIKQWVTLHREMGQVNVLCYQSDSQPRFTYGRDYAETVTSSCATKVVFNPGHQDTAASFSRFLGKKDVHYQTRSQSFGARSGGSNNLSPHVQQVPLVSEDEINRMLPGEAIIVSPGLEFRPYRLKIPLNKKDRALRDRSVTIWNSSLKQELTYRADKEREGMDMELILEEREVAARGMLLSSQQLEYLKMSLEEAVLKEATVEPPQEEEIANVG